MRRLIILIFFICLFTSFIKGQQDITQLKKYYTSKIEKYLDKEKSLGVHYQIDDSGIYIYPKPVTKVLLPEISIPWNKIPEYQQTLRYCNDESLLNSIRQNGTLQLLPCETVKTGSEKDANKKLSGIKIAIDPGHIAGDLKTGMLEKKFLNFKYSNRQIEIIEGQLTLQTALILKKMLEDEGAQVMLTRELPNQTAFGITFKEWLEKDFKNSIDTSFRNGDITEKEKTFLLTKATERDIFRTYFNNLDMKERAKKINTFSPDITLVIHYNVDESNTGWKQPSEKNFNMVFVAGSFLKGELDKPIDRIAFTRLLISKDIENSIILSEMLINSFTKNLNVPAASSNDATYLNKYCLPTNTKGVYSRNLSLTRLTKGVVAYGETLYQDNKNECISLSTNDTEIYGIKTSARVKQVAEAYYEGVINYLENK